MIRAIAIILLTGIGCWVQAQQPISTLERYELYGQAQGTTYTISYYNNYPVISQHSIDSIFAVIDESMSLYKADSRISTFNKPEIGKMKLDPHMLAVIKKSFAIYKESKGKFDVTVKPLVSLWGFGPEKFKEIPDSLLIKQTLQEVGMNKLRLRGKTLVKKHPRVQLDLNGIAQGYTVDVLHDYLLSRKIDNFIVEVGGEIRSHGQKPDGQYFKVLVQRPDSIVDVGDYVVQLPNKSITTAGSYEKYRTVKNYRFSHHINPKTGYPLQSNIISVTVITETAMDADAYDNVFMAMQPEDAIAFANKKNKMDIYLMYVEDGKVKEAYSKGFQQYLNTD